MNMAYNSARYIGSLIEINIYADEKYITMIGLDPHELCTKMDLNDFKTYLIPYLPYDGIHIDELLIYYSEKLNNRRQHDKTFIDTTEILMNYLIWEQFNNYVKERRDIYTKIKKRPLLRDIFASFEKTVQQQVLDHVVETEVKLKNDSGNPLKGLYEERVPSPHYARKGLQRLTRKFSQHCEDMTIMRKMMLKDLEDITELKEYIGTYLQAVKNNETCNIFDDDIFSEENANKSKCSYEDSDSLNDSAEEHSDLNIDLTGTRIMVMKRIIEAQKKNHTRNKRELHHDKKFLDGCKNNCSDECFNCRSTLIRMFPFKFPSSRLSSAYHDSKGALDEMQKGLSYMERLYLNLAISEDIYKRRLSAMQDLSPSAQDQLKAIHSDDLLLHNHFHRNNIDSNNASNSEEMENTNNKKNVVNIYEYPEQKISNDLILNDINANDSDNKISDEEMEQSSLPTESCDSDLGSEVESNLTEPLFKIKNFSEASLGSSEAANPEESNNISYSISGSESMEFLENESSPNNVRNEAFPCERESSHPDENNYGSFPINSTTYEIIYKSFDHPNSEPINSQQSRHDFTGNNPNIIMNSSTEDIHIENQKVNSPINSPLGDSLLEDTLPLEDKKKQELPLISPYLSSPEESYELDETEQPSNMYCQTDTDVISINDESEHDEQIAYSDICTLIEPETEYVEDTQDDSELAEPDSICEQSEKEKSISEFSVLEQTDNPYVQEESPGPFNKYDQSDPSDTYEQSSANSEPDLNDEDSIISSELDENSERMHNSDQLSSKDESLREELSKIRSDSDIESGHEVSQQDSDIDIPQTNLHSSKHSDSISSGTLDSDDELDDDVCDYEKTLIWRIRQYKKERRRLKKFLSNCDLSKIVLNRSIMKFFQRNPHFIEDTSLDINNFEDEMPNFDEEVNFIKSENAYVESMQECVSPDPENFIVVPNSCVDSEPESLPTAKSDEDPLKHKNGNGIVFYEDFQRPASKSSSSSCVELVMNRQESKEKPKKEGGIVFYENKFVSTLPKPSRQRNPDSESDSHSQDSYVVVDNQ